MTLTSFKPFIDLILNQETASKSDSDNGSRGEHSASIRVNSLFPKLLKLSSAASTAPLEVLSKDDPEHGQLPQKTNVLLKLYKTNESFFYWTFEIVEEEDLQGELFMTETEKVAQKQKASSVKRKTMSNLAQ